MPTSLYIHVPFCVVKCGYCDFNSYEVDGTAPLVDFIKALDGELELAEAPAVPSSVFIGGGTPTYLDEQRFIAMFEVIGRHVDLHAVDEVTMEANPESVTPAKAEIAYAAGVNRVSIGAQTFSAELLSFLDRAHSAQQTRSAVEVMRGAGFQNVSLDLMFGLPGQSLTQWEADLSAALELQPSHLSCYSLTFEPGTRLERDRRRGDVRPIDTDVDREMFLRTREVLEGEGFEAYEVSNFAGDGGPCHHNDHYWLQGNYVGVGPGAASHHDGQRTTNLKALSAWSNAVHNGTLPVGQAETLTSSHRLREALWLGLRRSAGVDVKAAEARLREPLPDSLSSLLQGLVTAGLASFDGQTLALTRDGLLHADSIGAEVLQAS